MRCSGDFDLADSDSPEYPKGLSEFGNRIRHVVPHVTAPSDPLGLASSRRRSSNTTPRRLQCPFERRDAPRASGSAAFASPCSGPARGSGTGTTTSTPHPFEYGNEVGDDQEDEESEEEEEGRKGKKKKRSISACVEGEGVNVRSMDRSIYRSSERQLTSASTKRSSVTCTT